MALSSFPAGARAAVIGASGGIGGALATALAADPAVSETLAFSRSGRAPTGLAAAKLDLTDEESIAAAAERAGPLDLVIVATGLLHDGVLQPEKDMRALDAERLGRAFAVNTIGPALVGKHFLPLLPRNGRGVFACLSARVGSIGDNAVGGWYGYRASKAALNMILRNFAIEIGRKRAEHVVLALQPGTVDTALSKPFQGAAQSLKTPEDSAGALLSVIDRAEPTWSGGLYDWRGERLPW
jgi:NAD(P)-dependent dehydrogenase (short-subunit alcohol dehydrogenase family)